MSALALPTPTPWPRRIGWSCLAIVIGFLSVRGAIGIWQQLQSAPPAAAPTQPLSSAPPLLTKEQRRQRAEGLVNRIGEGAKVLEVFLSPTGLTGVVLDTGNGGRVVAWMPDTHEALFIGAAFDRTGLNISQQEMVGRGFAKPDSVPPASLGAGTGGRVDRAHRRIAALLRKERRVRGRHRRPDGHRLH